MPEPKHAGILRPYRPSNATEGEWFMSEWCQKCAAMDFDDPDNCCQILGAVMAFSVGDTEYPSEWQYSNGGVPQCTAFTETASDNERCTKTPDMFGDHDND